MTINSNRSPKPPVHKALHEYKGHAYTLEELSKRFEVPYNRLYVRLKEGWSVEDAVERKKYQRGKRVSLG